MSEPNARFLKKSRRVRVGDIFCMLMPDDRYLFGKVVKHTGPEGLPFPGIFLVYIFRARSEEPEIESGLLRPSDLLIPPTFTNRLGWARGYWMTIGNEPIEAGDLLERHCFHHPIRNTFHDEEGQSLSERMEPCGFWGVGSYLMIDDLVSDALGIPRAPVDESDR